MHIPHPHLPSRTKMALAGTALGAAVTYIFSKPTLRRELQKAETTKEAMDILGRHVMRDTQGLSKEAKALMRSQTVQRRLTTVKRWVGQKRATVARKAEAVKRKTARAVTRRTMKSGKKAPSSEGVASVNP